MSTQTSDREIVTSRVIHAPRAKVWEAWTTAEHLAHWWGPNGFSVTTHAFDFRVGGVWDFMMHGPDPQNPSRMRDFPNRIVFTDIRKHELIAHDHGGDDGIVHFQAVVTFEEQGSNTVVTMRSIFSSREDRDRVVKDYGAIEVAKQTLARLNEYIQSKQ